MQKPFDFLIAADTMLTLDDGTIIGKAVDEKDAMRILRILSGRSHDCLTGVTIINAQGQESTFVSKTTVEFSDISDRVLRNYIETGEYKGCAGAYRIQGRAAVFVRSINGDYSNVVGLPIHEVARVMQKLSSK
ncbi:Septum formation inhibitor Maf [Aphelenchoides besseyi]|nr:Septum formation inhibitor Maf [Aphelenchoides besseyi]